MATLNFPQNPIVGDLYEFASYTYKWDGEKWKTIGTGSNPTNELRKEVFSKLDITNTYAVEALRMSYAEAGYDWDYDTDTIKPLKWIPEDGDTVWYLESLLKPVKYIFDEEDEFIQLMLEKGLLFKTKEECQEFADLCMSYLNNKK